MSEAKKKDTKDNKINKQIESHSRQDQVLKNLLWQRRFAQLGVVALSGLILWGLVKLCGYFYEVTG
ncbi:MAG: hypothetical protein SFU25_01870, partial [Candidatus Caenarcaniphilales bacterium]|nr:hypothetical protein [Candidatus Caenarcaniphilales bacterium]